MSTLNHTLSLRFDVAWRKRVARRFHDLLARPDARVLDLCCGTGDLAFALAAECAKQLPSAKTNATSGEKTRQAARITGADFAHPMLVRACEKDQAPGGHAAVEFLEADALNLPFADQSFDLVTTAFGFRNLANYAAGLAEVHRVLRPGGSIAILEFAEPEGPIFGRLYRFYFRHVLPRLGGIVSGNAQAYGYLPNSVARFPRPPELAKLMDQCNFTAARFERWTGGIVALHTAKR